jgi:hypothetical protein
MLEKQFDEAARAAEQSLVPVPYSPGSGSSRGKAVGAQHPVKLTQDRNRVVRTWIFQGNPNRFDIDGYFASHPSRFVWLVARYSEEMRPGDRVFIYRTGDNAAIVAEAEILEAPQPRPEEPEAVAFWRGDQTGADEILMRVQLRLIRVASTREVLRRDPLAAGLT